MATISSDRSTTTSTTARPVRYRFVDDLRGIAAVAVVLAHTVWLLPGGFWGQIDGRVGVEAFFTLSGFVMAALLAGKTVDARYGTGFLLKRSVRLDPPYWFVIVLEIVVLAVVWSEPLPDLRTLALNVVYLQELTDVSSIVFVAWTLCLELQFYVVLIVLYGVVRVLPWSLWTSRAVVFGPLAVLSVLVGLEPWSLPVVDTLAHTDGFFVGWWFSFFVGMLVHWVLFEGMPWPPAAVLPLGIIALVLFAGVDLVPAPGIDHANPTPLVGIGTAALLAFASRSALLERGLENPVTTYLGKISYSLYLVHIAVGTNLLYLVNEHLGDDASVMVPAFVLAWIVSIGSAHLLHRWVEQPAHRLSRRIG